MIEHYTNRSNIVVKDAELAMVEKAWGKEGQEDVQAILSARPPAVPLNPENREAASIFNILRKVTFVDESGAFNNPCIILNAYVLCWMYGTRNPNETVLKVVELFGELSTRNIEKLNKKFEDKTPKYVQ